MSIFLGSSQLQSLYGSITSLGGGASSFSNPAPPISGAAIGIIAGVYNNSSTWPNYNANIDVQSSPLVGTSSIGFYQFDGSNDRLALFNGLYANTLIASSSITQSFTMMFYGTVGDLSTRRAFIGNESYLTDPWGSDAIFRTDSSPASGYCHLDLRAERAEAGAVTRFSIPYSSGSIMNFGITYDGVTASSSLYVDGVLTATSGGFGANKYTPFYYNGGEGAKFGSVQGIGGTANFNGTLGGFYVYNRILTDTEISQSAAWFAEGNTIIPSYTTNPSEINTAYLGSNLVYTKPTTTTTTTTSTSTTSTTTTTSTSTTTSTTTTAAPSIPTDGLQFYVNAATASSYPGSGSTWYDLSANGYHLTMSGTPTFTGSNSIAFNGSSQYASLGNNAHLDWPHPTASITLLTFYKPSSTGTISGVKQIACKEETYVGSPIKGYGLQYNGNTGGSEGRFGNDMLGTESGNQRRLQLETTNAYQTSVFRFNGFTYDGGLQTAGACKIYYDGVSGSVATSTRANTLTVGSATSNSSNTKFTLAGRNASTTDAFSGRIGAVLQYNRALSSTEITTIYNILSASFTN